MSAPFIAIALAVAALAAVLAGCEESPTEPRTFDIVSPGGQQITVLPGEAVHFEVRFNLSGFTAQYVVDGETKAEGPTFDFFPTLVDHTVQIRIFPVGSPANAEVREFSVGVSVPGNLPPSIVSFRHEPEIGEALRDTFVFRLIANDPDGTIDKVVFDFSDGSPQLTLSAESQVETEHAFPHQGTFVVRALVTDDKGVSVAASDTVEALAPNQLPTGSLMVQGNAQGDAPVSVTLRPSGIDPDGEIVKWEIDTDQGDGYVQIQSTQIVQVQYEYREEPYRPKLRLTDNKGDAVEIESDQEILVFRQIAANRSRASVTGNPQFANVAIAPAIWADGQDAFLVEVTVEGPDGEALEDVPVRVTPERAALIAPDGQDFGVPVSISPADPRTGANGRVTILLSSETSTRVEAAPEISFRSFDLKIEASRGHGEFVELDTVTGLNVETVIGPTTGKLRTRAANGQGGYCAGDLVDIIVQVKTRNGAPGNNGPARNRYTVIRRGQFADPAIVPTTPGPGFSSWRTNGSGEIVLQYRPTASDKNKIIVAWVDGQPLEDLKSFNFRVGCS